MPKTRGTECLSQRLQRPRNEGNYWAEALWQSEIGSTVFCETVASFVGSLGGWLAAEKERRSGNGAVAQWTREIADVWDPRRANEWTVWALQEASRDRRQGLLLRMKM